MLCWISYPGRPGRPHCNKGSCYQSGGLCIGIGCRCDYYYSFFGGGGGGGGGGCVVTSVI